MGRGREEGSSHSPPRAYCYFHRDTKREPVQRREEQPLFSPWRATMVQWWEHSPPTNVTRVQISASTTCVGVEFVDGSLPCSDSKTTGNVIVGWKTKTCTILCPPHSVFLRIYVVKMSRGQRRKWHFQDRKLKNFLREYTHRHPLVWSAFGDLTFLPAPTPSKSKATPLIHTPIGTHLCYFLEIRSKLNTMPAPRSVKIDNPRIFTANNSLMERIVIELRD